MSLQQKFRLGIILLGSGIFVAGCSTNSKQANLVGERGPQGPAGYTGEQGLMGYTGSQGAP